MWVRIFHRIGNRFERLSPWGIVILAVVIVLLIAGLYRLLG